MIALLYFLIFGKWPCTHKWEEIQTVQGHINHEHQIIKICKCQHCGVHKSFKIV